MNYFKNAKRATLYWYKGSYCFFNLGLPSVEGPSPLSAGGALKNNELPPPLGLGLVLELKLAFEV